LSTDVIQIVILILKFLYEFTLTVNRIVLGLCSAGAPDKYWRIY